MAIAVIVSDAQLQSGLAPNIRAVLSQDLKFSDADLGALARGNVVKHSLDVRASGEIAVVGAVRIGRSEDAFLARVRDVKKFKSDPDVLQIGVFSDPPVAEDLADLTFDKADGDLRSCRVGDCDIRLPADAIGRFQREIDWRRRDAEARATALFKEVLFKHVRAYWAGRDDERITQYDDDRQPVRPFADFASLLRESSYIGTLQSGLPDYLASFPAKAVPGAQNILYWSKERFGVGPFITVTHMILVPAGPRTYVTTTRDVYSSRYIDASLSLAIATGVEGAPGACYLVYANRSRANALKGAFSGLRRSIAERRLKGRLDASLETTKRGLEALPPPSPDR